jgi:formylglycine-generating enzyme required for sulfatase activity
MLTLELTIQRKTDDGWPVVAEQIQPGLLPVRSEGLLRLDQTALLRQITPHDYGVTLGQAVFQGSIRDAFVHALAESAEGIRLLCFVEAPELRSLRWERLCAPVGPGRDQAGDNAWDFLALNQRTLFSRYLPSVTDRSYPPIGRRDLRALVLIASPGGLEQYGLAHFDVNATAAHVATALGSIPFDLLASGRDGGLPNALGPASVEALCQQLTVLPYTLVHVVCHGHFDRKSGETSLFLANQNHQLERTEGKFLLMRLGRLRGQRGLPYLTFLATCDSAASEAEGALGGLAQRLVRDLGMPAVIAMTEKVSITTADRLTSHFYNHLQEHGEVDRALVEATIAVAKRGDVTVPVIYSRLGGQPLFSRSLDRELTSAEISYGLDTLQPLLTERAPVLQPRFEPVAATLRRLLAADLTILGGDALTERQAALAEVEQITTKAVEVSFKALSLGHTPPHYDARCPFLGLVAFGAGDRQFFFGRGSLVQQVRQRLAQSPFIAILGPSGSGKSSLVLAGLLPLLQQENSAFRYQVMTPGADPLVALKAVREKLLTETAVTPLASAVQALLVVDQFEESFTLCTEETKRRAFFQQLLALTAPPPGDGTSTSEGEPRVALIVTMRADFWGDCAAYPNLRDQMLAQQLLIPPMNSSELRAAMEQQALTVGLRFEADLANTILDDVVGEPGAMPLLQHALRELWQRRYGRWLVAAEYRAMGGVKQAIAGTADLIYASLGQREQTQMRTIFLRLTRLDAETPVGDDHRDTRRRLPYETLASSADAAIPFRQLINQLTTARLLNTTEANEVEVAHEALIRHWGRLRRWIAEDRQGLLAQQYLAERALEWRNNGRDASLLLRGPQFRRVATQLTEQPVRLNSLEAAYFQASNQRAQRIKFLQISALIVVLLLAAIPPFQWLQQYQRWQAAKRAEALMPAGELLWVNDETGEEGTLALPAFWIDRFEVSYAQYRLCVETQHCTAPREPALTVPTASYEVADGKFPVVWVDAYQAAAYCRWRGGRLPTEAEWERVATGGENPPRSWPWLGDEQPTYDHVNVGLDYLTTAWPSQNVAVDDQAYQRGASPDQVMHLIGNVWEWTATTNRCQDDPYRCQEVWDGVEKVSSVYARGGGWQSRLVLTRERREMVPLFSDQDIGFRCVRAK